MATASEVKSDLDIKTSSWSKYISEGIVRKEKVGQYDSIDVAKQIIRHQQARSRKTTSIISNNAIKINKLEKLLAQQSVGVGTVTDDGVIFEKAMTKKEKQDYQIGEQKLIKMKHEQEVSKKS